MDYLLSSQHKSVGLECELRDARYGGTARCENCSFSSDIYELFKQVAQRHCGGSRIARIGHVALVPEREEKQPQKAAGLTSSPPPPPPPGGRAEHPCVCVPKVLSLASFASHHATHATIAQRGGPRLGQLWRTSCTSLRAIQRGWVGSPVDTLRKKRRALRVHELKKKSVDFI